MSELFDAMRTYGLQGRVLRQWHNATGQGTSLFDERELLTVEVLGEYGSLTERKIARLFGLPPSSANSMTKRLRKAGIIEHGKPLLGDRRNRPLQLTVKGREVLADVAAKSNERMAMFFANFTSAEKKQFAKLLLKFGSALSARIDDVLFEERKFSSLATGTGHKSRSS